MKIILIILVFGSVVIIFGLLDLRSQINNYRKFWDRQNSQQISKNEIVYVVFGDSTAQGIGASSPEKGYVGNVAKGISRLKHKPVHVINLSKSGAKVKDVLVTQLPKYEKLKISNEQVITIAIGANDILDFDAQRFEAEMDELMGKLPKQTIISDIPPFSGSRMWWLEPKVEQANQIIYKLADKHGYSLAELHETLKSNGGLKTYAIDLFHPNNYAYRENWAKAFLEQIK